MRTFVKVVALMTVLAATDASAQAINLSGRWRCTASCPGAPGSIAYITQYGRELNISSEAGQPSRAWVDYPGRVWVESAHQGAIYSPDGTTLQFDRGMVWQRVPPSRAPAPRVVK